MSNTSLVNFPNTIRDDLPFDKDSWDSVVQAKVDTFVVVTIESMTISDWERPITALEKLFMLTADKQSSRVNKKKILDETTMALFISKRMICHTTSCSESLLNGRENIRSLDKKKESVLVFPKLLDWIPIAILFFDLSFRDDQVISGETSRFSYSLKAIVRTFSAPELQAFYNHSSEKYYWYGSDITYKSPSVQQKGKIIDELGWFLILKNSEVAIKEFNIMANLIHGHLGMDSYAYHVKIERGRVRSVPQDDTDSEEGDSTSEKKGFFRDLKDYVMGKLPS